MSLGLDLFNQSLCLGGVHRSPQEWNVLEIISKIVRQAK